MNTTHETTSSASSRQSQGTGGGDTRHQMQEKAGEVANQAKHQANQAAHQAQERAYSMLEGRKQQAAQELNNVAHAFRQTGHQLRDEDNQMMARYTDSMADQVERVAGYLDNNDVEQFLADAENFARRQPELFLGGAFTLGLLAARFFKSSSPASGYGRSYPSGDWREPRGSEHVEDYPARTGTATAGRTAGMTAGTTAAATATGSQTTSRRTFDADADQENV